MKTRGRIIQASERSKILDHLRQNHSGPENVLVLFRNGDADGEEIAGYYAAARGISSRNVLGVDLDEAISATASTAVKALIVRDIVRAHISTNNLTINFAVFCGYWPYTTVEDEIYFTPHPFLRYICDETPVTGWPSSYFNPTYFRKDVSEFYSQRTLYYDGGPLARCSYPDPSIRNGLFLVDSQSESFVFPSNKVHLLIDDKNKNAGYYEGPIFPFRLEHPPTSENDTTFGVTTSHVDYIKRQIDDTLTAEKNTYGDIGSVILSASSSSGGLCMSFDALLEIEEFNIPYKNLHLEHLNADVYSATTYRESECSMFQGRVLKKTVDSNIYYYMVVCAGKTAVEEPTYPTTVGTVFLDGTVVLICARGSVADNFAAGTNSTVEATDKTWTSGAYTDVFFQSIGDEAYYSTNRQPQALDDYNYRTGAIVLVGQSYGATPQNQAACDYDYDTAADLRTLTTTSAKDAYAYIYSNNSLGKTPQIWGLMYDGAGTSATVAYAAGIVTFTVDGSPVGTVDISSMTLREATAELRDNLPADWTLAVSQSSISRCAQAVKAGAAFVAGAFAEPFGWGMIRSKNFLSMLYHGVCMGDICVTLNYVAYRNGFYGDPLYCPFRWRRQ